MHIGIVGSGAVGSYIGGRMALAGLCVSLIDPWPAHVEAIRRHGLVIAETTEESTIRCPALHICDVQSLQRNKLDIAFICVKLYDTRWAVELIAPYVKENGLVVTLQNGLVEDEVASIARAERTLGAIGSTMSVFLSAPGRVQRAQARAGPDDTVFYVGEIDGHETGRVQRVVELLDLVDHAAPTGNLIGERWAKLTANTLSGGLAALAGTTFKELYENRRTRRLAIRLAGEAIRVGVELGLLIGKVRGISPAIWSAAASGDASALARLESHLLRAQQIRPDNGRPAMAADLASGRRTEVDWLSGLIVRRGRDVGVDAPTHARVAALIHEVEAGRLRPGPEALDRLESD